jgi:cytochrome c2
LGPGNTEIVRQGPSLVGILGRRAGSGSSFNYTKALIESGLTWDSATSAHRLQGRACAP